MGAAAAASAAAMPRIGRAPLKQSEKIWVTSALVLILFLVGTSQAFVMVPYFVYDLPSEQGKTMRTLVQLLVPFNFGALGILWNYYKCVTMDPGSTPPGWKPPLDAIHEAHSSRTARKGAFAADITTSPSAASSVKPRFCRPCKAYKPPRSHHCRTCKRCVLRMDHHCPWIANCVGQRNYASFIRFLAYVDVTCAAHLALLVARTSDYWWLQVGGAWRPPSTWTMTFLVLNFALCIPTFLLVGVFSLYHFWNLCTNTTTIEGWEKDKVDRMITRGRIREVDYPFDLGALSNIRSVLGSSPLHWCFPSITCGSGLEFEVASGIDYFEQYDWPPRDPNRTERAQRVPDATGSPFTYGNESLNPALVPSKGGSTLRKRNVARTPPWHPDYAGNEEEHADEAASDTAAEAGVDTGQSCAPPLEAVMPGNKKTPVGWANTWQAEVHDESGGSTSESDGEGGAQGLDTQRWTRSRVRRGSEGYEVRPKRFDMAFVEEVEQQEQWPAPRGPAELAHYYGNDNEASDAGSAAGDDASEDDAEWLWQQQQHAEEMVRQQIQAEWRRQLHEERERERERRAGGDEDAMRWSEWDALQYQRQLHAVDLNGNPAGVLLPSQIQQHRAPAVPQLPLQTETRSSDSDHDTKGQEHREQCSTSTSLQTRVIPHTPSP